MQSDVKLVSKQSRCIPLWKKEEGRKEEEEIIKKIILPIVVTINKTGGIRLCFNLCAQDNAVVVDSHPLPYSE